MPTVTCFGEVLWDVFPTHKKIGGAPLNVALRLKSFEVTANVISRVGSDEDGKEVIRHLNMNNLNTASIQIDQTLKTGCVNVALDKNGSATYEIEAPVAWDRIETSKESIEAVRSSDAFIFGSLACRDAVTRRTLLSLLPFASFKVFDLNLRPPFYTTELLMDLMKKVDFIKCNDDELHEMCSALNMNSESIEEQIKFLAEITQTGYICVTKGKDGAVLFYNNAFYHNSGYPIKVADTVGAGDSFLAALMSKLLFKESPNLALDFACAVGALVASKKGATPELKKEDVIAFMKK